MNKRTAKEAAQILVKYMTKEDKHNFTREGWREGVSMMLFGDWEHLNENEILDEMERLTQGY
jgi:hypothetical protein